MGGYAVQAIQAVAEGELAFCKFLSANDAGGTGAHQAGILISKTARALLFAQALPSTGILDRWVRIVWQGVLQTDSRFTYYSSKNELRITNFGRGFPFLRPEYTGALFVLTRDTQTDYRGFFLNTEEEIDQFLEGVGIGPTGTNRLIWKETLLPETREQAEMDAFIAELTVDFPPSEQMSDAARQIHRRVYGRSEQIITNPDKKLLDWTETEYRLFRAVEQARYGDMLAKGFSDVEAFITAANQVLNRRKSRAGKSLEHHLSAIFDGNGVCYQAQAVTEMNKKPDFLFPSQQAYRDASFPVERLACLAAKTTCKDRWRQILNEADRLKSRPKYLCTLQQGISEAQMDEMEQEQVVLVVPRPYISTYPKSRQAKIWTLGGFVRYLKELEQGP